MCKTEKEMSHDAEQNTTRPKAAIYRLKNLLEPHTSLA